MKRILHNLVWPLAIIVIAGMLFLLPGRDEIAPVVKGDNCYIFLAVDRFCEGNGFTTLYPLAPEQPWEWRTDWAFLTQWPPAYPLLLAGIRIMAGVPTLQAAQWISVFFCAVALVGWFRLARRLLPGETGVPGVLLATLVSVSSVATWMLINPGTDLILHGLIPWLLLLTIRVSERHSNTSDGHASSSWSWAMVGLLAGSLVWIRYMAIFVPVGIGLYISLEWLLRRGVRFRAVMLYAASSLAPVIGLCVLNHVAGLKVPEQERYNLGGSLGTVWDPGVFAIVWKQFTAFPIYAYHAISYWIFLLVIPFGGVGFVLCNRKWRQVAAGFFAQRGIRLSICVLVTLFVILAATSMLFRAKHTFVGIDRYYISARPFYFLLFLGPLLLMRPRPLRWLACIPILLSVHWFVTVEWPRPMIRWHNAQRPATDYGRWADAFEPGETDLYRWLRDQASEDLVLFSNFHSDIALETGIPAIPTPQTPEQMNRWLDRIEQARDCDARRILFVLPMDNGTGDYYLPDRDVVISQFNLAPCADAPSVLTDYVFQISGDETVSSPLTCRDTADPSNEPTITP